MNGRLELSGPRGGAVLVASGDAARLSVSNVRTALNLLTLRGQLRQMTGLAPRLGGDWPDLDIEVSGWRVAKASGGTIRPTLPARRAAP